MNKALSANFSPLEIKQLTCILRALKKSFWKQAEEQGRLDLGAKASNIVDAFIMPMYYVWEHYGYGDLIDLQPEGESLFPYMMFQNTVVETTTELIDVLRTENVFQGFEKDDKISETLVRIYEDLLDKIGSGIID